MLPFTADAGHPQEYDPPVTAAYWREWRARLGGKGARPVVVLHGGYGKRNLGDEAILHVLLGQIREAMPQARIIALCHGPAEVQRQYSIEACYFASPGALRAILAADLYVIGGGGIINRINVYSGWQRWRVLDAKGKFLFLAALLAKACGARVIFQAIGATSVPDPLVGWLARWAIGRADAVSVRDPLSRQVLQQLGVRREIRVVPDPAVTLEAVAPPVAQAILRREEIDPDERLVGLNLRPIAEPDVDNSETARTAARLADWMIETYGAKICFLPFGRHPRKPVEDDMSMAREMVSYIHQRERFHILQHPCTPPEMKGILGEMDFCLLERLHAAILAAGMGTPFIAISYEEKVAQFVRSIGLESRLVPLREFTFETAKEKVQRIFVGAVNEWPTN